MSPQNNLADRLDNLTLQDKLRLADAIFEKPIYDIKSIRDLESTETDISAEFENRIYRAVKEIKQFIEENPSAKDYQQFILDVIDGKHPEPLFNKVNIQFEPLTPDNVPSDMKALVESFGKDITTSHDLFEHLEDYWDKLPDDLRKMCVKADSALSEEIELHYSPLVWQGDKLDASNQRALLSTMYRASLYERLNIKEAQNVVLKENSVSEKVAEKTIPKVNISSYANNPTATFMVLTSRYGGLRANDIISSGLDVKDIDAFKSKDPASKIKLVQAVLDIDSSDIEKTDNFEDFLDKALSDVKDTIDNCSQEEYNLYVNITELERKKGYDEGNDWGYAQGHESAMVEIAVHFDADPDRNMEDLCKDIESSITKKMEQQNNAENIINRITKAANVNWGKDKDGKPIMPTPEQIGRRFAFHRNNATNLQKSADTLRELQISFIGRLQSSLRKILPASLYNTLSALDRQIHSPYSSTSLHPQVERNLAVVVDGLSSEQRKETAEGIAETERLLLGDWKQGHEKLDRLSSVLIEKSQEVQSEEQQQNRGLHV